MRFIVIVPGLLDTLFYYGVEIPLVAIGEGEAPRWLDKKLRPGMKFKLPFTQAMELLRMNLAQIDYESIISLQELRKLCWSEEKSEVLQPLEEGFYLKVGLYMSFLRNEIAKGRVERENELKNARIALSDLLSLRLKKIVTLALTSQHVDHEKARNMTLEEKLLYIQLCATINSWREALQKISGGAER